MADYLPMDPITRERILAQLPDIQRRTRRIQRLREEAKRGEDQMTANVPLGSVGQGQMGGLYQTVAHYVPNYSGQMQKAIGALTNYNVNNRADTEEDTLNQMRVPEIMGALGQYSNKTPAPGVAGQQELRGYLGLMGMDVKDLGLGDNKVRSTQKLANGNLGLVTDDGIQDTGMPYDYGIKTIEDAQGNTQAVATSGAGRGTYTTVTPAGAGAPPAEGAPPAGAPQINIEGMPPEQQHELQTTVASMTALGMPQNAIDEYVARAAAKSQQQQLPAGQQAGPMGPVQTSIAPGAAAPVPGTAPPAPVVAAPSGPLHVATAGEKRAQELAAANAAAPQTAVSEGMTEAAKKQAQNAADARAQLPALESASTAALANIDKLYNHPGLKDIVGTKVAAATDEFPLLGKMYNIAMSGTPQADALALHNAAKSGVFLKAYQLLKGGGSITEVEGKKAEAAMGRMDRSQSYDAYRSALTDFRDAVQDGLKKMRAQAASSPAPSAPAAAPAAQRPALPAGFSWGD